MNSQIRTQQVPAAGYVFEVDVAGELDRPLVLLLHGFPQTSYAYRHTLPVLADAGYLAVAPNQRGYSPLARPPEVQDYATRHLLADALAIATAFGAERFHLVGHDWGGQLAWLIAASKPERLQSLCVLSRPHPAAFVAALEHDPKQSERSRHHRAFNDPNMTVRLLENGAARLRRMLADQGVAEPDVNAYLSKLSDPSTLEAALNWYRAAQGGMRSAASPAPLPAIRTPTLYVWGELDASVGRSAAEATAGHVDAPYQFECLPNVGHFLTDQVPDRIHALILPHLRKYA